MQFSDLDRDVQKKIISKMDIDARRALGGLHKTTDSCFAAKENKRCIQDMQCLQYAQLYRILHNAYYSILPYRALCRKI